MLDLCFFCLFFIRLEGHALGAAGVAVFVGLAGALGDEEDDRVGIVPQGGSL